MQVAPQQVTPGENFQIFYFLRNHSDATTYYIRARIYDVATDELLITTNLTQSAINSRLFIATVNAPGDQAGYGRNIVAIATVYTDSGYTTRSPDYEEQEQYFLVKPLPFFGGGGGVDARTVREIVQEQLEKHHKAHPPAEPLKVPDAPDMSFVDALFDRLGAITREVGRIPKEAADLQPLKDQITDLSKIVEARPQFKPTDLSSLAEGLQTTLSTLRTAVQELKVGDAQLLQSFDSAIKRMTSDFETSIAPKIEQAIQSQELTITHAKPEKKAPEPEMLDLRHLML